MTFEREINKFAEKTAKQQDQYVRSICFHLLKQIVDGTPVDTGRAKGNWQTSINNPSTMATENKDKDGARTIAAGSADIAKATGRIFYISNNLPYIRRLEFDGWSKKQAPHGWVRAAVNRVKASIR